MTAKRSIASSFFLSGWSLLAIILLTLFLAACSRSEFEKQHQRAVLQNPTGVELEIHIRGGNKQFAVSEPVEFEEFYTSKYPGLWQIEIIEGWNDATNATLSDVVYVTDGKTIWSQPRKPMVGIICCDSRHVWLGQEPVRIPYKLSASPIRSNPEGSVNMEWQTLHLPNKPGRYGVYLTTQRVFGSDDTKTYQGKGFPVSSNILDVQVK